MKEINEAKIKYITLTGGEGTGYINVDTGIGVDKHTDVPVKVFWSNEDGKYYEEVVYIPKMPAKEPVPFVRVQPKRLTRKQRRK